MVCYRSRSVTTRAFLQTGSKIVAVFLVAIAAVGPHRVLRDDGCSVWTWACRIIDIPTTVSVEGVPYVAPEVGPFIWNISGLSLL